MKEKKSRERRAGGTWLLNEERKHTNPHFSTHPHLEGPLAAEVGARARGVPGSNHLAQLLHALAHAAAAPAEAAPGRLGLRGSRPASGVGGPFEGSRGFDAGGLRCLRLHEIDTRGKR